MFGTVLQKADEIPRHVYFPLTGYLSLIASRPGTPKIEVGLVGNEGFVGSQLLLGVPRAPWLVVVQGAGTALRMPAAAFTEALVRSPALEPVLKRYVASLMAQFAHAAPCMRFHQISPRLARWLLMTQDRASSPRFRATHVYLSYMLGVRRAGVSEAASELQKSGSIAYGRGTVTILDRKNLKAEACSCYAADSAAYRAAMRSPKKA